MCFGLCDPKRLVQKERVKCLAKRCFVFFVLCFADCASLYNLVNKANLVQNLFLVYLSISTCFRRLCAHHQEKQLCLCDTCYLLICVDDCLVCRSICSFIPDSHPQNNKYQMSHKHSCFSWWWAYSRLKHVQIDKYNRNKYTKNKLLTKLVVFYVFENFNI